MLTKTVRGSLEVKEVIKDKDKIAELDNKIIINADGAVGIGIVAPSAKIDVK